MFIFSIIRTLNYPDFFSLVRECPDNRGLTVRLILIKLGWYLSNHRSSEWSLLSDREKDQMGLTFDDDGEFW